MDARELPAVETLVEFVKTLTPEEEKIMLAFGQGLSMQLPATDPTDPTNKAG